MATFSCSSRAARANTVSSGSRTGVIDRLSLYLCVLVGGCVSIRVCFSPTLIRFLFSLSLSPFRPQTQSGKWSVAGRPGGFHKGTKGGRGHGRPGASHSVNAPQFSRAAPEAPALPAVKLADSETLKPPTPPMSPHTTGAFTRADCPLKRACFIYLFFFFFSLAQAHSDIWRLNKNKKKKHKVAFVSGPLV